MKSPDSPTCLASSSFCTRGMAKAAVLPDPVRALASTSFPSRAKGMAFSWMGVGCVHPSLAMACRHKVSISISQADIRLRRISEFSIHFIILFPQHGIYMYIYIYSLLISIMQLTLILIMMFNMEFFKHVSCHPLKTKSSLQAI